MVVYCRFSQLQCQSVL